MKNLILLLFLSIFTFANTEAQTKQSINVDTLKIGNSSSAYDPTIELSGSNVKIKANKTTGKAQFTIDGGAIWKNLGSGSGSGSGGVSSLENGSFEDGQGSWANSGGNFTIVPYTNPSEGNLNYASFVATSSGQYFETPLITFSNDITGACLAYIGKYNTSDNNAFDFRLLDSSGNQIDSKTLATTNGVWSSGDVSNGLIAFPCPSAGTQYRLRVVSLSAGVILSDLFYTGSENRLVRVQPNGLVLDAYFAGNAGCTVSTTSSSSWSDFGTAPGCLGLTVNYSAGGITASTADIDRIDRITVSNLKAGKYKVTLHSQYNNSTTANFAGYRITDGTQNGQGSGGGASASDNSIFYNYFDYSTDQSSVTFKVQCYAVSPSTGCSLRNDIPTLSQSKWIIERVDSSADLAISQSQSEWMIDASIGGANITLGTSNVSSYTEITNASLDLVINSSKRSAPATIPCSGTNPSTGLICSAGNEGLGLVFNPPYAGTFQVCASFGHAANTNSTGLALDVFQLVLTSNSSQTILDEGLEKSQSTLHSANDVLATHNIRNCSIFNFSDTSTKTIRLMYEQNASGTITSNNIIADRSASAGQRDIHFTVIPLKAGIQPMKMGDTVTTPNVERTVLFGADISSAGVITNNQESIISSASCSSGNWTINTTGLSSVRSCYAVAPDANSLIPLRSFTRVSSNQFTFSTDTKSAGLSCVNLILECRGVK